MELIRAVDKPGEEADLLAANVLTKREDRQAILDELNPVARLEKVCAILMRETDIADTEKQIQARIRKQVEKNQKDYYLREQIKAIQTELGDGDETDTADLRKRLAETPLNEEARAKCEKELDRLSRMAPGSPESSVSQTYIEWILDLPWGKETEDNLDLNRAREILNRDHYGLEDVKERIIEYLAVLRLKKDMKGPILCFVGPPGVGKTSIVKAIAEAVGRKFVQVSLGGVRDEAEIRGHRRTYIGSIPGRIIAGMKQAGTCNPVFLFDEIDKMSGDFRGDPASAMLEVLDSEQNHAFRDHNFFQTRAIHEGSPADIPQAFRQNKLLQAAAGFERPVADGAQASRQRTLVRPAPVRTQAEAHSAAAPAMPMLPTISTAPPKVPL